MIKKQIYIYDSTLRDGAQTKGVDFSVSDKIAIAKMLDDLGIDYIEGGWPGANNTDTEFFKNSPRLKNSKLVSFGMTYKNSSVLKKNFNEIKKRFKSRNLCIVGKTWDFQVNKALNITEKENLNIIKKNIQVAKNYFDEVLFDAEHFFDGFKSKKQYALECIKCAYASGARWVVLCDTNGGTLPYEIEEIVKETSLYIPTNNLGIHCHNDTDNAVANTIAAVRSGVRQVQGTFNGLGERCGNTNLTSIIPTLILKMHLKTSISKKKLRDLTKVSKFINERLLRKNNPSMPYVGESAFAHKGGLHASGVKKHSKTYEHIEPEIVGNKRSIIISNQSGKSSLSIKLKELGFNVNKNKLDYLIINRRYHHFDKPTNYFAYSDKCRCFMCDSVKSALVHSNMKNSKIKFKNIYKGLYYSWVNNLWSNWMPRNNELYYHFPYGRGPYGSYGIINTRLMGSLRIGVTDEL